MRPPLHWKEYDELVAKLQERGGIVGDPKYFIVDKCKQLISMNTLGDLPSYARDMFNGCLTEEGMSELELRVKLKKYPGTVPKEYL